jgi:hypothetical protein
MDENFQKIYTSVYEAFGGEGERVLGFAMMELERTMAEEMAIDTKYKDHPK